MIPDVKIVDWNVDPTQNVPTDGTFVGTDMPRQLRNIKSITRGQYQDRWEPFPLAPTKVDANTVKFDADGTAAGFPIPLFSGWAARFHAPNGTLSYGYGISTTIGPPTTVDLVMTQGTLPDDVLRMDIGMIPEARANHEQGRRGTFVISGTATTAVITFATIALPPMPRAKYHVSLSSMEATGTGTLNLDAFIPQGITAMSATGFTANFLAPGGGRSITWEWAILFPFQAVNY